MDSGATFPLLSQFTLVRLVLAEKKRFELLVRHYRTHPFQGCAFDRSAISPELADSDRF